MMDIEESREFREGFEVGESTGEYNAYLEVLEAHKRGEIELWLELHRPKSPEEWAAWEEINGSIDSFKGRWKQHD